MHLKALGQHLHTYTGVPTRAFAGTSTQQQQGLHMHRLMQTNTHTYICMFMHACMYIVVWECVCVHVTHIHTYATQVYLPELVQGNPRSSNRLTTTLQALRACRQMTVHTRIKVCNAYSCILADLVSLLEHTWMYVSELLFGEDEQGCMRACKCTDSCKPTHTHVQAHRGLGFRV